MVRPECCCEAKSILREEESNRLDEAVVSMRLVFLELSQRSCSKVDDALAPAGLQVEVLVLDGDLRPWRAVDPGVLEEVVRVVGQAVSVGLHIVVAVTFLFVCETPSAKTGASSDLDELHAIGLPRLSDDRRVAPGSTLQILVSDTGRWNLVHGRQKDYPADDPLWLR